MGDIELAAPVTHIWYFKGVPSRLGYLLDLAPKDLEKIIYFAAYVITSVNTEQRHTDLSTLENEALVERKRVEQRRDADVEARAQKLEQDLAELEREGAKSDVRRKVKEGGEREMRQLRDRAQRELDRLEEIWTTFVKLDVQQLIADEGIYRELYDRYGDYFTGAMGAEAIQTLARNFDIEAEAENLRETIRSGKGQKKLRALKRLKVVAAFQATGNSPVGMVLDCVPVIPPDLRPMVQLDGGRFATSDLNDLYRRVINRNNRLKRLIDLGDAQNIKSAKRMVERQRPVVWDVLEEVISEHPVLLNRAPTLHRLGIQAFEPQLIEGKAIQIHPLVCEAFNADFDGDQMAVHLPLSAEAQAEARILMLSSNNILSPSSGRPVTMPSQDMIIGLFWLTTDREGEPGEGRQFASPAEAIMAFDRREITLQSKIKIRFTDIVPPLE